MTGVSTKRLLRQAVVRPVRLYQRWISPMRPATCKYHPSCSAYAITAIERHGIGKGLVLAGWRLLRCNPWSKGGVDDVPPVDRWRSPTLHLQDCTDPTQTRLPAA